MSNPLPIAPTDRLRLTTGVRLQTDRLSGESILVYPEGLVKLNATGAAIVRLCDGSRSVGDIAEELGRQFDAPREAIQADVAEYLLRLRATGLIAVEAGQEKPA